MRIRTATDMEFERDEITDIGRILRLAWFYRDLPETENNDAIYDKLLLIDGFTSGLHLAPVLFLRRFLVLNSSMG